MTIVARFYPNGEFSHGVDTSRRRKDRRHKECRLPKPDRSTVLGYLQFKEKTADIDLQAHGQSYLSSDEKRLWVYKGTDQEGHHLYDCINSEGADTLDIQMDYPIGRLVGNGQLTPLVHQMVESSPAPLKSRKRLTSMTKNMARNIRNGVYLLEQWYGKDQLSFLTLTLPNLSTDELRTISDRWDDATDQILKWLRKRLQKVNINFEYVYCTEIQTKRLHYRNEYAPHLHIIFRGRNAKKAPWAITPTQVRKAWISILGSIIGHKCFDGSACENLQRIRYSAARYLSKYMSKGACCLPVGTTGQPEALLRTQWGGMARKISEGIRRATIRMSQSNQYRVFLLPLLQNMEYLLASNVVRYYRQGFIVTSVCSTTGMEYGIKVGAGCLQTPTYQGGVLLVLKCLQELGVL